MFLITQALSKMADAAIPNDEATDTAKKANSGGDVFDRLFGDTDEIKQAKARNTKRKAHASNAARSAKRKPKAKVQSKPRIRAAWLQFIAEVIKTPANQADAYRRVYTKANEKTAYRRANELLNRPEIASEIARRQNIRAAHAEISRAKMEGALTEFFQFDMRRFFYNDADEAAGLGTAGEAKKPHHLTLEEGQALESYEKKRGKYGDAVKVKGTPRLASAELLAKLKGWVKDDGRPPIMATFNFNWGQNPGSNADMRTVEAVPPELYSAMGLRDADLPAKPLPSREDENGDPVKSTMPPGYEAGRGVRFGGRGRELAMDLDAVESGK